MNHTIYSHIEQSVGVEHRLSDVKAMGKVFVADRAEPASVEFDFDRHWGRVRRRTRRTQPGEDANDLQLRPDDTVEHSLH